MSVTPSARFREPFARVSDTRLVSGEHVRWGLVCAGHADWFAKALHTFDGRDPAIGDGLDERAVIPLGEIGVGTRELGDRMVELIA